MTIVCRVKKLENIVLSKVQSLSQLITGKLNQLQELFPFLHMIKYNAIVLHW